MIKTCPQCNKEFKTFRKNAKCCSFECAGKIKKGLLIEHLKTKQFKKGEHNGIPFKKGCKGTHVKGTFTGKDNPNYKGGLIKVKCSNCDKDLERKPCHCKNTDIYFCSAKCRGNWISKNLFGSNSANYKNPEDRISDKNVAIRSSREGVKWVHDVTKRDKRHCVKCGSNKRITAHHLSSFTRFPEFRFDIDNGVTLCVPCHRLFHHIYGTKNFTADDFYEFLSVNTKKIYE